jgi:acetyl/propionyl-CoA carboxylase alpha subunit
MARLARWWENAARRTFATPSAGLVVALALGSSWMLQRRVRALDTPSLCSPCLHVVAATENGRLAWVREAGGGRVASGEVVARLEAHAAGAGFRSPIAGKVRAVVREAGEAVQVGDPVLVVGLSGRTACP